MKIQTTALVHCAMEMERLGLEHLAEHLPFSLRLTYADLATPGILHKLDEKPDLIILCEMEGDGDFGLAQKIKLFAPDIPLLVMIPAVPKSYLNYLRQVLVDEIIQKPFKEGEFEKSIVRMISPYSSHS